MRKLLALLFCFVGLSAMAQLPPILRLPWTTNSNGGTNFLNGPGGSGGAAVGVLLNNGNAYGLTNHSEVVLTNYTSREISIDAFASSNPRGAVGGGRWVNHCYATNGSVVVYSSDSPFTSADAGKILMIEWGGTNGFATNGHYHASGISNVISSSRVALSNAPVANVTNWNAWVGFDDTPAVQAMVNYTVTNGRFWKVLWGDTGYTIAGPLLDTGNFTNHHNAQIYAPDVALTAERSVMIQWIGVSPQVQGNVTASVIKQNQGTMIVSTLCYAPNDDLNRSSVFEWKSSSPRARDAFPNFFPRYLVNYNNVSIALNNLWFREPFNCNLCLFNAQGTTDGPFVNNCMFDTGWNQFHAGIIPFPDLTASNTVGLAMSQEFSDNRLEVRNTQIGWFHSGLMAGENMRVEGCQFWDNVTGVNFINSGGNLMTFVGCNTFADNLSCLGRFGSSFHLDGVFNAQNSVQTNFALIDAKLPDAGTTNYDSVEGRLTVFYTAAVGTVDRQANLDLLLIDNHGNRTVRYGNETVEGIRVFKQPFFQTNTIAMGSDFSASTLTANTRKHAAFMFPLYSGTTYAGAWGSVDCFSASADNNALSLGRDNSGFSAYGMARIDFYTSDQADGANGTRKWYIDSTGAFKPDGAVNIGTSSAGVSAGYFTNVVFLKTNPAPTSVTVGTTATDTWIWFTNAGVAFAIPAWKNH